MISAIFGGMPILLLTASLYWAFKPRPGKRPPGTLSLSALLACFSVAFSAYQPAVRVLADSAVALDFPRLVSNSATLSAAASVSALLIYLNYSAADARRRVRQRVRLLALAVAIMAVAFAITPSSMVWSAVEQRGGLRTLPTSLHVYSVAYIAYLGYAVYDCLTQTWTRSKASTRTSQRIGLRMTALGCLFALVYAAYKTINTIAALFGWNAVAGGARCTSLVTPADCAFSVTAPAVSVLLITIGLTLPAVLWPVAQFLRHRWERKTAADLLPLWRDLTEVSPSVVLTAIGGSAESDLVLHRRVVEVCDGILDLDVHRSRTIERLAAEAVERRGQSGTETGAAIVEAAILAAAIEAARTGALPQDDPAPQATGEFARAGDLRAEALWLRSVSQQYATSDIVRTAVAAQQHTALEAA
ncbi:MAB_1171c family putative transporter [Kitasatospora sp. NPDC036755]|uniref:MAB_1171c family putative transporter n=1 Tax=Kitasatospora sp. NPDC036755 TaxID=3154600 RepID=UPI0033C9B881